MSNEIVHHRDLTPSVWEMIGAIAPVMKDSRLFGVSTAAAAAAIMAKGFELGLPLTAAFEFIVTIQDRPVLIPRGALALILSSGQLEKMDIDESKPDECTVTMKRKGGLTYSTTFSMADAQKAGLVKPNSAWVQYPRNMMKWRAVGYCADVLFSDVLGGLKRADEFGADLSPEGDVIESTWQPIGPQGEMPQAAPDLMSLVQQYGAPNIVAANGGKLPQDDDELRAVALKLGGVQ